MLRLSFRMVLEIVIVLRELVSKETRVTKSDNGCSMSHELEVVGSSPTRAPSLSLFVSITQ